MNQRVQDTDAYILMQFGQAIQPLLGMKFEEAAQPLKVAGAPYYERLRRNGHDNRQAVSLLAEVWKMERQQYRSKQIEKEQRDAKERT